MELTVEQYEEAITNSLSEKQIEVLQTLYYFPNSSATAKELAKALHYSSYHAANRQIGEIGKRIANHLEVNPIYSSRRESPAWYTLVGEYNKQTGWEMEPNLQTALENLKLTSDKYISIEPSKTIQLITNAFIFVWNPKLWNWDYIEESIKEIELTGKTIERWSCGNRKSILPGDRVFLVKVGTEPKGIIATGVVKTYPFLAQHWNGEDKEIQCVEIEFDVLLNPEREPILTLDILIQHGLSEQHWTPQASGIIIKPEFVDSLEKVWFDFLITENIRHNPFNSLVDETQEIFFEGTQMQVSQTRYERNPYARQECIKHYGYSCMVCGFNFTESFGSLGNNFIHVHHLTQVAAVKQKYEVHPIKDLRPVCPNCHAMLHKRNPPFTIEELKAKKRT